MTLPRDTEPVKRLQQELRVEADGIIGRQTTKALIGYKHLTNPLRVAHFLGQLYVETAGFKWFTENLNYSKSGLLSTFTKYFSPELAEQYAKHPEQIANRVYANRMGNGDESSGDGWKYRGRGAIQLTGKNNYNLFADYMGNPEIVVCPDIVYTQYPFDSAFWYFDANDLWNIADQGIEDSTVETITRRINGGRNGLKDRIQYTRKYYIYTQQ